MTPRNTIDIQNRIVFAVELEFTSTSPLLRTPRVFPLAAPDHHLPLLPLPLPCKRPHRQTFFIAPYPIRRRQAVAHPYTVRCGPEPKVIALQAHPALFPLVPQPAYPFGRQKSPTPPCCSPRLLAFSSRNCSLGDPDAGPRFITRREFRRCGKAARPPQNPAARQYWPAFALPPAYALLVQQPFQLVRASVAATPQFVALAPIPQH